MKTLSRLAVLFVLVIAAFASMSSAALGASQIKYADEFNGPLDKSTWTNDTPWNTHYTTGESEWYDPANLTFANGMMTFKSEVRAQNGYPYSSAIVTSLPRQKFSYGYFEVRAQLPKGKGIWPAFWLTNDHSLEIDGFEVLGDRPDRIYMTLHENDAQIYQGVKTGIDTSAGYHVYGIDWQPTYVKWYIDGVECAAYNHPMPSDGLWICLNTAVGGSWPGLPDATTKFPVYFNIDYVRVYDTKPTPNASPVAAGDSYTTSNAQALSVSAPGLLGNDSDADGDALTAAVSTPPSHGSLSLAANGTFTYTPEAGFAGTDSFAYRASDGTALSAPAQVSIGVAAPLVFGPSAVADAYSTPAGTSLNVTAASGVLANDVDTMGRDMTAAIVRQPGHGTVVLETDGSFAYTPATGFSGSDSFTYIAADGTAVSNATSVNVTVVAPVPTVPTVVTKPIVKVKSRAHRQYRVGGAVRLGSSVQPKTRVVVTVQAQRYSNGRWRSYKSARLINPAANYRTVLKLRSGRFRVRTVAVAHGHRAVASKWSKSFRVR